MRRTTTLLAMALLTVAACGDDSTETLPLGSTTTAVVTTAAVATTTTIIPATTLPETSTSTAPPATLGPPPLPQVVFDPNGIRFAAFGEIPETVLGIAQILWGPPADDTGVLPSEFHCPGTQYRKVVWVLPEGTLTLMFSDDEPFSTDGGPLRFTAYGYQSPSGSALTAGPPVGVDVGTSVAEVLTIWPTAVIEASEFTGEEIFRYTPGFATGVLLTGRLTGLTPTDTVLDVWGGRGCLGDEPGAD